MRFFCCFCCRGSSLLDPDDVVLARSMPSISRWITRGSVGSPNRTPLAPPFMKSFVSEFLQRNPSGRLLTPFSPKPPFPSRSCGRYFADVGGFPAPPDADDAERRPGGAAFVLPEARSSRHVLRRGGAAWEKKSAPSAAAARPWGRCRRWRWWW